MNKFVLKFLFFIFFSTLFASCQTTSFLPQTQNVPLFTRDSQLRVSTAFTYRSIELQGAYSPINHFGIILNTQANSHYFMPEIGVGGYYSLNKKIITEIYGGYGYGKLKFNDTVKSNDVFHNSPSIKYYDVDLKANKYFLQPAFGIKFNDKIDLALSFKICYWDFSKYSYLYRRYEHITENPNSPITLQYTDSVNVSMGNQFSFEPAITFKVGGKYAKFMMQTGIYFLNNSSKGYLNPYNPSPFFIRLGATVNVDFRDLKE